jgi:hypothetical protein
LTFCPCYFLFDLLSMLFFVWPFVHVIFCLTFCPCYFLLDLLSMLFCVWPFVHVILCLTFCPCYFVLSVLLRFTASFYPFGILTLFFLSNIPDKYKLLNLMMMRTCNTLDYPFCICCLIVGNAIKNYPKTNY